MKKFAFAMAAVACLFVGCKKTDKAADGKLTKENMKVGFVYIGTIDDEGYTQAHDKGRLAVEAMGIKTAYI